MKNYELIGKRDLVKLNKWLSSDPERSITRLAAQVGVSREYLTLVCGGRRRIIESMAERLNEVTGLSLTGVPSRRGKHRPSLAGA